MGEIKGLEEKESKRNKGTQKEEGWNTESDLGLIIKEYEDVGIEQYGSRQNLVTNTSRADGKRHSATKEKGIFKHIKSAGNIPIFEYMVLRI